MNINRFDIIKWSYTKKSKEQKISCITDADLVDDLTLLANTPAQAESLLQSLELAARVIDLYVNSDKTRRCHLHIKWQASKISRPVHIS